MQILIVSPESDIQAELELIAAAGQNTPKILNSLVSTREVISEIASGRYNAVHFAAHGSNNALLMSDGYIDDMELQQAFELAAKKGMPIDITVLNACNSITSALKIYSSMKGGPSYVVAWRDKVEDSAAQFFAVRFWRSLALDGEDVKSAFDNAQDALLREFPNAEPPMLLNGIKAVINELTREVARQNELIEKLQNPKPDWYSRMIPISLVGMTFIILLLSVAIMRGGI